MSGDFLLSEPGAQAQMQAVLRWWQWRQTRLRRDEAMEIREGLLQESFCLRRSLELAGLQGIEPSEQWRQHWLDQLEQFHRALTVLSDRLESPYIDHSLPLAIQHLLTGWQAQSNLDITWDLPKEQGSDSVNRNQIILTTLDEFLRIILSVGDLAGDSATENGGTESMGEITIAPTSDSATEIGLRPSVHVSLNQQNGQGMLTIRLVYQNEAPLTQILQLEDLDHLSQSFRSLTSGRCLTQNKGLQATWYFHWRTE